MGTAALGHLAAAAPAPLVIAPPDYLEVVGAAVARIAAQILIATGITHIWRAQEIGVIIIEVALARVAHRAIVSLIGIVIFVLVAMREDRATIETVVVKCEKLIFEFSFLYSFSISFLFYFQLFKKNARCVLV